MLVWTLSSSYLLVQFHVRSLLNFSHTSTFFIIRRTPCAAVHTLHDSQAILKVQMCFSGDGLPV